MALTIKFDREKCEPREAQIIDALIATHMTFRGGHLRAAGLSSGDPNYEIAAVEFTTEFMKSVFPDMNFHYVRE